MCSMFANRSSAVKRDREDALVANRTTIVDAGDPRLLPFTGLTDVAHRRGVEQSSGTFVVEGVTAIRVALTSPYPVRSVLVTAAKATALADALDAHDRTSDRAVEVLVADQATMNAVTGFDIHRGAVAVAERLPLPAPAALLVGARTVAVLEGINDHENLGAIGRSALALGVDALLLDPTCADPLYRRCVRVSMGQILHLPYARTARTTTALTEIRAAGFVVVALTPSADAEPIDAVVAAVGDRPVALVLGAEGSGLTPGALSAAEHRAAIPLRHGVDSLNVGHAAAIAFHAFSRRWAPPRPTIAKPDTT
jgi:tRNA G18 (ribose-2'-O)-methylase SpoU